MSRKISAEFVKAFFLLDALRLINPKMIFGNAVRVFICIKRADRIKTGAIVFIVNKQHIYLLFYAYLLRCFIWIIQYFVV